MIPHILRIMGFSLRSMRAVMFSRIIISKNKMKTLRKENTVSYLSLKTETNQHPLTQITCPMMALRRYPLLALPLRKISLTMSKIPRTNWQTKSKASLLIRERRRKLRRPPASITSTSQGCKFSKSSFLATRRTQGASLLG